MECSLRLAVPVRSDREDIAPEGTDLVDTDREDIAPGEFGREDTEHGQGQVQSRQRTVRQGPRI